MASFRPLDGVSLASHLADQRGRLNGPLTDSLVPADGPRSLSFSTVNWSASMIAHCERTEEFSQSTGARQSAGQLLSQGPVIHSNGGGATAIVAVPEKTIIVTRVDAINPNGTETLTYSVVSGADAALFSIDPSTGVLTFVAPPEFDHPLDADGNSVYEVIVQVSNSIATATQAIAVEVTSASESVAEADNTDGHPPWTAYARSSASNSRVNDFDVAGTSPSHSLTGGHSSSDIVRPSSTAGVRFSDGAGASSLGHALPGGDVVRPGITGARFTATAQVTAPTVQTMPSAQVGHLLAIAGTYTVLFGVDGISSHAAHHTDDGRSTDLLIEAGSHDGALAFADTDNLPSNGETDGVAAGKAAPDGAGEAKNPGSTPVAPIIEPAAMQAAVSTESEATLATPLVDPVAMERLRPSRRWLRPRRP